MVYGSLRTEMQMDMRHFHESELILNGTLNVTKLVIPVTIKDLIHNVVVVYPCFSELLEEYDPPTIYPLEGMG